MFDIVSSLEGVDTLNKALGSVSYDIRYKGGRFALRKAANLIADAVKKNAERLDDPDTAEEISKNVAVRWSSKKFKRTGDLMFRVGLLGGAKSQGVTRKRRRGQRTLAELGELAGKGSKNPGGDTWYWRLLEFGTRDIGATPFMRPALEKNGRAVMAEFVTQAKKSIDRAVKKAKQAGGTS